MVVILVAPIALFPEFWFWSAIAVGIITLFYVGIFKLSMMFLDPVDNDDIHQSASSQTVGFDVGVLDVPPCLRSTLVTHGQLAFQGGCNGSRCDAAESPIIFFTGGDQS